MRPTATAPQRRAVAATVPGWFWSGAPAPTPFGVAWEELYSVRPAVCKTLIMICLALGCPRQRCCPLFNHMDVLVGHVCTGVARVCERESSEDLFLATGEEPRHVDVACGSSSAFCTQLSQSISHGQQLLAHCCRDAPRRRVWERAASLLLRAVCCLRVARRCGSFAGGDASS